MTRPGTPELFSTLRYYPDTIHTPPDTTQTPSRHPQTPQHIGVLRIRGHWKNNSISECYDQIWWLWIASIPDSIQSHPNTLQTPSRHLTNTPKFSTFWLWGVTGRKGNSLIWQLLFNCLWFIWHLYSPRHLLDTPRYDPDTVGDPQTPSRHSPDRHRRFYVLEGTGRKGNIWVGMTFIHFYQQIWY